MSGLITGRTTLTQYFDDVMDNPVDWAKKCVDEYKAEALNIWLHRHRSQRTEPFGG